MYVDVIRRFLSLIFRHKFIASPRANRSRYQKYPGNFARSLIKAASSNERALAPGLTANGGFRKSMNGEQYAFQVINTGGICQSHLYLPNFLLPAGGAMTITGYWHVDVFMPAHLSNI